MAWQHIHPITAPPDDVRETYTRAIVQNKLYIYRTDLPHIVFLDMSVPGIVTPVIRIPTFLNMAGIEGIVSGRSRLVAWDDENVFSWSSSDDHFDFTPSLETRANTVNVDAIKGNVIHCLDTLDGFVIYTTSNIVKATFTPQDPQNIYTFREITDNIGIFSKEQITFGEEGVHYAFTNGGLYRIDTTALKAEPIAPDVSDYITAFEQPPRLGYHLDRFLTISLPNEGVNFGRTARQRNFLDALTYFRDKEALDRGANFDRTLFPEGFDFLDGFPVPCEDSIPNNCDTNVLWGAMLAQFPKLDIIQVIPRYSGKVFITTDDQVDIVHRTLISSDGETVELEKAFVDFPHYDWTQETYNQNKGEFGVRIFPRFSFDPLALMLYQAYLWQATDLENRNIAKKFKDITAEFDALQLERTDIASDIITVSTKEEIDENILGNDVRSTYKCTSKEVLSSFTGVPAIRFTNQRTIIEETEVDKKRKTTVQEFWIEYAKLPAVVNIESTDEVVPGEKDGEIDSVTSGIPGPPQHGLGTLGLSYLTGEVDNIWENDDLFKTLFFEDLNISEFHSILNLAPEQPISTLEELWSTGRTIVAQTDRCTFANIRCFVSKRAVTEEFTSTGTQTARWRFIGTAPGGLSGTVHQYHREVHEKFTIAYGSSTEIEHNDLLTLDGPDVPMIREIEIFPLAKITGLGNPQIVLEEYFQEAKERGISILDVYEERGWTIEPPPAQGPFVKEQNTLASPILNDRINRTDTTIFKEFFESRTVCGEPFSPIVVPNEDIPEPIVTPTEVVPEEAFPETVFLTQQGQPGALFPTYTRALIFDRHLRKWGTANLPHKFIMDISPINEVVYDPILEVGVTRFTFDNFLRRLGALLDNGMLTLFDDAPKDSYIVYGKIGFNRQGRTRITEVEATFAEHPNAAVILESSLDGRFLDPYNIVTAPATKAGVKMPANVSGNWFNIVVRGRYHLTQLAFTGLAQGKR